MTTGQLESLLQKVIASLESSIPHTPSPAALAAHWDAWNAASEALRNLQNDTLDTSKTK
jgi:hypothetical protein